MLNEMYKSQMPAVGFDEAHIISVGGGQKALAKYFSIVETLFPARPATKTIVWIIIVVGAKC